MGSIINNDNIIHDRGREGEWVRKSKPSEMVNHPEHYGGEDNAYEAIKIIEAQGWGKDFCLGNALKYILRAGKKGAMKQDLEKAVWYLNRAIEKL